MAILQLLIIMNYSRGIIGFLSVDCIFIRHFDYLTLEPTQPDPPKTENFVTQPDPNRPYQWMDPTHVQLWSGVLNRIHTPWGRDRGTMGWGSKSEEVASDLDAHIYLPMIW